MDAYYELTHTYVKTSCTASSFKIFTYMKGSIWQDLRVGTIVICEFVLVERIEIAISSVVEFLRSDIPFLRYLCLKI